MAESSLHTLVPAFRNRIMASGIGTYLLRSSTPSETGTWVQMGGTMTDQLKDVANVNYAGNYTGSYVGYYDRFFNGFLNGSFAGTYSGTYTGYYTGHGSIYFLHARNKTVICENEPNLGLYNDSFHCPMTYLGNHCGLPKSKSFDYLLSDNPEFTGFMGDGFVKDYPHEIEYKINDWGHRTGHVRQEHF